MTEKAGKQRNEKSPRPFAHTCLFFLLRLSIIQKNDRRHGQCTEPGEK
jgi:hypothetical protein